MKVLHTLLFLSCLLPTYAQNDTQTIKSILLRQQADWNRGDLEAFMVGYWESDSLMFIGSSGIHYGYENTLKRYVAAYPDREAMGTLTFRFISMQQLDERSYFVIGKYQLERTIGDLEGYFTLLWRKINGQWKIVADHSS